MQASSLPIVIIFTFPAPWGMFKRRPLNKPTVNLSRPPKPQVIFLAFYFKMPSLFMMIAIFIISIAMHLTFYFLPQNFLLLLVGESLGTFIYLVWVTCFLHCDSYRKRDDERRHSAQVLSFTSGNIAGTTHVKMGEIILVPFIYSVSVTSKW